MNENQPQIHRPIQSVPRPREPSKISDSVHMAAYEVYAHVFGPQDALIQGRCRGGFGIGEVIAFLYARSFPKEQWKKRVHEALDSSVNL